MKNKRYTFFLSLFLVIGMVAQGSIAQSSGNEILSLTEVHQNTSSQLIPLENILDDIEQQRNIVFYTM